MKTYKFQTKKGSTNVEPFLFINPFDCFSSYLTLGLSFLVDSAWIIAGKTSSFAEIARCSAKTNEVYTEAIHFVKCGV